MRGQNITLNKENSMKLKKLFYSFLPGIFLIGYNIGTGSVTSMSKSGANYGTSLLWTVAISCLITYYLITHFSRFTLVTGMTVLEAVRKHLHPWLTWFFLGAISIIIIGAVMGVMGVIADVLEAWSWQVFETGIPSVIWAIFLSTLILLFFWTGNTNSVKTMLSYLVILMFFALMANLFFVIPDIKIILQGLIPSIPKDVVQSDNSALLIMASMVGTTVSVIVFLIRSILVKESDWTVADIKAQKRDARLSVIGMFLVSTAIMVSAAATLHARQLAMNNASEMIPLLEPLLGTASITVMAFGILAAGLSSHIPNIMVIPWLLSDIKSEKCNLKTPLNRTIITALTLAGITIPLFNAKPVFVMLLSQGLLAILLPAIVGVIFYLTSSGQLMKEHRNKTKDTIILAFILLFALFMGGVGLVGFIKDMLSLIV
ncbi:divalent metal cation transporter [candidate division KSB1 bacterium]|nr:divalent metal cation transporter [candidate division KSB1 bacterium]